MPRQPKTSRPSARGKRAVPIKKRGGSITKRVSREVSRGGNNSLNVHPSQQSKKVGISRHSKRTSPDGMAVNSNAEMNNRALLTKLEEAIVPVFLAPDSSGKPTEKITTGWLAQKLNVRPVTCLRLEAPIERRFGIQAVNLKIELRNSSVKGRQHNVPYRYPITVYLIVCELGGDPADAIQEIKSAIVSKQSDEYYIFSQSVLRMERLSFLNYKKEVVEDFRKYWYNIEYHKECIYILRSEIKESFKLQKLVELLKEGLRPAFVKFETPADVQDSILQELSARFLEVNKALSQQKSWVERTSKPDTITLDLSAFRRIELPRIAPATWKKDKLRPSDSVSDFITRHYGPEGLDVLRSDGTGLHRIELMKLDPSIANPLKNYLLENELPSDCPLPTKSEVNTMRAKYISELLSDDMDEVRTQLRKLLDALNGRESRKK